MPIPFYNQGDQDIYASGEHFIPQERFRQNYTPSTALAGTMGNTGITNTQVAAPYKLPPRGGGGGGGFSNTNKYGLDLDTQKTITVGMANKDGVYVPTPINIAKSEGGIWKNVDTNQNVYHGNIDYKGLVGSAMDKIMGKETIPGVPQVGSTTGAEWEEDLDPALAHKKLNMIQRWKAKKKAAVQAQFGKDVAAAKPALQAQSAENRAGDTGGWQSGMAKDEAFMTGPAEGEQLSDVMGSFAQGGRIGYQGGELVEDEYMAEATPGGMIEENIEEVQGEPSREQLEAIAFEIFQLPLEQLNEEQLEVVYQAAMEQEPSEEEVQFAAQEGPGEGIASLV